MDTHGNENLLLRTKWFIRGKIAACTFFLIILVPWYKSSSADATEECAAGNQDSCDEHRKFLMFMFSPLFIYFGITLINAIVAQISFMNHMKNLESNGRQNDDF